MKRSVCHLIRFYYDDISGPGNLAGGNLHVVLDDGNLDDRFIFFCREQAEAEADWLGVYICDWLREIPLDERERLYDLDWPDTDDAGRETT